MMARMAPASQPARFGFIPSVLLSVVLNPLNSATISVGLAVLLRVLHATPSGITWIVSGYYLGSAVAQPIMGTLGDRVGYRRFMLMGFFLVLVTAILAPLSTNLWVFVGWRAVQAIGTSMIYPNAIGLVRRLEERRLAQVLGWIGMAAGVALAVGPALGGLMMARFGWQAIFWLNIPIVLAAALLLSLSVRGEAPILRLDAPRWDWTGSGLFFVTMVLLLLSTSGTLHHGAVWVGVLGLVALMILILVEKRSSVPVLPVSWFKHPAFAMAGAATLVTNVVMYLALYGVPVLLETRRHLSTTGSGLMLLVFAGMMALASPVGGRLARGPHRRGPYLLSALVLVVASGLVWISRGQGLWAMGVALGLMGLSFAVSNVVLQQMVLEMRPQAESGSASGLYSLMRYVGTMASSVVIALAFVSTSSIHLLFVSLIALSVVATLLGCAFPRQKISREEVAG